MNKNILEICLSPDLGGLELCVVDYFKYFKTKTKSYLCVASKKKLDNYVNDENKFSIKRNTFFPIITAFKLGKYIDEKDIDFVHFHWTKDIFIVVLAKLLCKRRVQLMQSRHMTMTRFKDDIYHKWLYKHIDIIHAVTYQVKEQLEKFIPVGVRPKVEMIYLGVDEPKVNKDRLENLNKKLNLGSSFTVGIVGRIEEAKGQYLLIKALEKLQQSNVKLLIVGSAMDKVYLENLKKLTKDLKVEKQVIFTGFTKEINEYISLCDVTVLATQKETFGLVIIESMVNKVPVIATSSGGPLEIIDDEVNGLLFDRSINDLSSKIKKLLNNTALTKKLAKKAFDKVKNKFDKEKQMNKMYEMINES